MHCIIHSTNSLLQNYDYCVIWTYNALFAGIYIRVHTYVVTVSGGIYGRFHCSGMCFIYSCYVYFFIHIMI